MRNATEEDLNEFNGRAKLGRTRGLTIREMQSMVEEMGQRKYTKYVRMDTRIVNK